MRCQDLGGLLRSTRESQGLSQRRLALRAGTSQDAISRIERGAEAPTLERFERLMLAMGQRVEVSVEPPASPIPEAELAALAKMTPSERLSEAASWNRVAAQLAAAGEHARRAGHPATRRSER
jgi:transcriptional regulator with XRE-family HTH domain